MFNSAKLILLVFALISSLIPSIALCQAAEEMAEVKGKPKDSAATLDLTKNEFSSETRIGIANATGNTRSLTILGNNKTKYRIKRFENNWRAGAHYERVFSSSNDEGIGTNARYIYGAYRFDYYVLRWMTLFAGGGGYTDKIKGIDLAGEGFGGARFFLVQRPSTTLSLSTGYNYTYENRLQPNPNKEIHSATQGLEFNQKIGKIVDFLQLVEALENVRDGRDSRINSETLFKININKFFGVVLGFTLRFDNRPVPGFKKLDTLTEFSLALTL